MRNPFANLDGLSSAGWMIILGIIASIVLATKIAISLSSNTDVSLLFVITVWIVVVVAGTFVVLIVVGILNELLN